MLTAITLDAHWQEKKKIRGPRVTIRQNTRNAVGHKTPLSVGLFFLRSTPLSVGLFFLRSTPHEMLLKGPATSL